VSEGRERAGQRVAELAAGLEIAIERDLTQGHHDADAGKQPQLLHKEGPALVGFLRQRFVARGRAADRGRDVAVDQAHPVVLRNRLGLAGEAEPVQGAVEPIAAAVSGEHPSRAVATVRRRCETHDQQTGLDVPEAGDGFPPIRPAVETTRFAMCDLLTVGHEAGTPVTGDDGVMQDREAGHARDSTRFTLPLGETLAKI